MKKQISLYESGNELAAMAAKQINYHVMGYYPITPSTQIAENLDLMKAQGLHDISLIAAEGEHSAASANGLLYALEQLPVQSGTRFPMVMNVACRTVSGPLSIKGDHSDIMMMLNCGWIILFANSVQMVYDYNLIGLKLAEAVNLPVAVAFDGFFTSHQKRRCMIFADDQDVQDYVGPVRKRTDILDTEHPVTIGSYMNEPDLINNKYQLHEAMEQALNEIEPLFEEFEELSGRPQHRVETYRAEDAAVVIFALGSTFHTLKEAVDQRGHRSGSRDPDNDPAVSQSKADREDRACSDVDHPGPAGQLWSTGRQYVAGNPGGAAGGKAGLRGLYTDLWFRRQGFLL